MAIATVSVLHGKGQSYSTVWAGMSLMLYLHNSTIQRSMTHSNDNLGVLYWVPYCGTEIKSTSLTVASDS